MSSSPGLIEMARQGRLDVIAGLLGVLVAIGLLPIQLFISQVYVRTLPIVVGGGSLLYLFAVRGESSDEVATFSRSVARLLPNFVILGAAALIAIAALKETRTLLFYSVASAVGTVLFAQILFVNTDDFSPGLLLFQIVLFGLVIRFCALYTMPGYIGIDVWTHMADWGEAILNARSLQPISDKKYWAAPLYHLLVVGASLLLDVPLRAALYLVIGLAMPISVLLIYATATFFVRTRWAVFATAAYSVNASVIEWGLQIIPTSLGLIFFLAVFYCLERMLQIDYKPRDYALVVFFSVAVIFTHQVSAFIMLVLVGSGLLAYVALGLGLFDLFQSGWSRSPARESVNLTGLMAFDLGLITFSWAVAPYYDGSFLTILIDYFINTIKHSRPGQDIQPTNVPPEAIPSTSLMETVVMYLDVIGYRNSYSIPYLYVATSMN